MDATLSIFENEKLIRELSFCDFNIDYKLGTITVSNKQGERFLFPFKKLEKEFYQEKIIRITITLEGV